MRKMHYFYVTNVTENIRERESRMLLLHSLLSTLSHQFVLTSTPYYELYYNDVFKYGKITTR